MRSRIVDARVVHERFEPAPHRFERDLTVFGLDLDELPHLGNPLFGLNRFRPYAIRDADHLSPGAEPIRDKLAALLDRTGTLDPAKVARVFFVFSPRYFGAVFNPVGFHFLYDATDGLVGVVAEVNNTFGEKHVYPLALGASGPDGLFAVYAKKDFHVSPFFDLEGDYRFRFADPQTRLHIEIDLLHEGRTRFHAHLTENRPGNPLDFRSTLTTLLGHPVRPWTTMPRILWQAARLYFQRRLDVYTKPRPASPNTLRSPDFAPGKKAPGPSVIPDLKTALSRRLVHRVMRSIRRGRLTIFEPDITATRFGGIEPGPTAVINVRNHNFYRRAAESSDVGVGESYTAGEWTSPDLKAVFHLFLQNRRAISPAKALGLPAWMDGVVKRLSGLKTRKNDRRGGKANIAAHYDLSNELFALFLDSGMVYSSAVFATPDDPAASPDNRGTLEAAQRRKFERLADLAGLQPGMRVLEIGCGWGGFAEYAATERGCSVLGVTISERQHAYAVERMQRLGLADRVEIRLCDYRDVEGVFDAIVSIEMLEAVGHEFHPVFAASVERLLAKGGRAAMQTIVIADAFYDSVRRDPDWIRKHIFPGGLLPSLTRIATVFAENSDLCVRRVESIGLDYARTLARWRERFLANRERVLALGFGEDFIRTWTYYLTICEAGFESGHIDDLQILLERPAWVKPRSAP